MENTAVYASAHTHEAWIVHTTQPAHSKHFTFNSGKPQPAQAGQPGHFTR